MFWGETQTDRRLREVDKEILAEHGITHPRAEFLLYSCPRPAGDDWGYLVDEYPVPRYAKGRWWPLDTDSVRLGPNTREYAWYCEYIGLHRGGRAHLAVASFTVHIPKLTGGGSFGVRADAEINMRDRSTAVLSDDLTDDLTAQAQWTASKILELLLSERDRRRGGAQQALTFEELSTQRSSANDSQETVS